MALPRLFFRHCERSEAIQKCFRGASLDCFVVEFIIGAGQEGRPRWLLAMTRFSSVLWYGCHAAPSTSLPAGQPLKVSSRLHDPPHHAAHNQLVKRHDE